jgi:hypothetical protein
MKRTRSRTAIAPGLFTTPGGLALVVFLAALVAFAALLWLHVIPAPAPVPVA